MKKVKIRNVIIVPAILLIIIYLAALLSVRGYKIDISGYKGDGVINRVGAGFVAAGYEIEFDKFDLNKPYHGKYIVNGLPKIEGGYVLYLRAYDRYKMDRTLLSHEIVKLVVKGADGGSIVEVKSRMTDWIKTSITGGETTDCYYFKDDVGSWFNAEDLYRQPIYIEFEFQPIKNTQSNTQIEGRLVLRAGGSK